VRNNTSHEIEMNKYDVLDTVFGSDHRPVVLELVINLKQTSFMDEFALLDSARASD
jgi:hypothetical protein